MRSRCFRAFLPSVARAASTSSWQVAVVGSGPGGCYTAERVLKELPNARVDILDRLPTPYGLVRYGVAPDHQDVKNVTSQFENVLSSGRCGFVGNVRLGHDLSLAELSSCYDMVVLAYGGDRERMLQVPGEDLPNVMSSHQFVAWYHAQYNGHPDAYEQPSPFPEALAKADTAVIIGNGNVAIDVARVLLAPPEHFAPTDMPASAVDALRNSNIRHVYMVGRRNPAFSAFTTAEVRQLIKIGTEGQHKGSLAVHVSPEDLDMPDHQDAIKKDRPRRRQIDLLRLISPCSLPPEETTDATGHRHLVWNRAPASVREASPSSVAIDLSPTSTSASGSVSSVPGADKHTIKAQVVFRSAGYLTQPVDAGIPQDPAVGHVQHTGGRVAGLPGAYVSGWAKTGPRGVINICRIAAHETAASLVHDASEGEPDASKSGLQGIRSRLHGHPVTTFGDWKALERLETQRGAESNKVSEK
eukprot:gene3915-719_t